MSKIGVFCLLVSLTYSQYTVAQCADRDAKLAADRVAENYYQGRVFKAGTVLKKHLPSERKEVVSYIQRGRHYYSVFLWVDTDCQVQIIKQSKGKF